MRDSGGHPGGGSDNCSGPVRHYGDAKAVRKAIQGTGNDAREAGTAGTPRMGVDVEGEVKPVRGCARGGSGSGTGS